MTVAAHPPVAADDRDQPDVCAVCGAAVENDGAIEDSSGWRWFSDGQGGLLSLCPTCPVPSGIVGDHELSPD